MSERSLNNKKGGQRLSNRGYKRTLAVKSYPGLFTKLARQPRIEYFRSFSVVPPCEAFASLFSYTVFDYRGIPTLIWLMRSVAFNLFFMLYDCTNPSFERGKSAKTSGSMTQMLNCSNQGFHSVVGLWKVQFRII